MEESKIADNNEHALVPVTYEAQKKQRNLLLKMKAKAMGAKDGEPRILFDIDEQNTFITGGGVPGSKKRRM